MACQGKSRTKLFLRQPGLALFSQGTPARHGFNEIDPPEADR
jgi:hypothetical protein